MNKPLFVTAVIARLPLATFTIGVLVHVQHLTGSYGAAGAAAGALAAAQGVGGPALGKLVDRRGQTRVLIGTAAVAAGCLVALAMLPAGVPLGVVLGLAAGLGAATPPVAACLRTLIPMLFPDSVRRTYAVDAAATELTWVAGPPLALGVGSIWGSGAALTAAGLVLVAATTLFALSPASRHWRPTTAERPAAGALASPTLRALVGVMIGVGVLFGAAEVAMTAAAAGLGHAAAAGSLLGLWGVGSLLGGIVAARRGGGAASGRGFATLLALLGLGHVALGAATGGIVPLAIVVTAAGTMIAPVLASAYAMVDRAAPAGTVTEAFAWLATASAVGAGVGAAAGGALADVTGPAAVFVLAGCAGLAVASIAALAVPARVPAVA
jgi:MFS family permease